MFSTLSSKLAVGYLILLVLIGASASILADPDHGLLVKYGPNNIGEKNNSFEPPGFVDIYEGTERIHPLGTDGRGRDVAANLIFGCRTSILLGVLASLISVIIGTVLGLLAGFYGDESLKTNPFILLLFLLANVILFHFTYEYSWISSHGKLKFSYLFFISSISIGNSILIYSLIKFNNTLRNQKFFPVDSLVMRFAEIFRAIPGLFILLTIIAFIDNPNIWTTALLLGGLGWSRILRLVRGEVMEIRNKTYVTNAKLLGLSDIRIFTHHLLPNVLPIILVSSAFLISGNILLESALSFLGIGIPIDLPSWGGLLRQSREDFNSWWLAIFPGLTITLTLFALNILAESYNKSLSS